MVSITKTDHYTIIRPDVTVDHSSASNYQNFVDSCKEKIATFKKVNLIIDFSELENIDLDKILLLSPLSDAHKTSNASFVVVCEQIDFNAVPDTMVIAPTFQEAEDIIEMEDIERDLGI